MTENDHRPAEVLAWLDPTETIGMTLRPSESADGALRIAIRGSEVHVEGTNCIHRTAPKGSLKDSEIMERLLAKIELSLGIERCQITWEYREQDAEP